MNQQRRADARHFLGARLAAVKRSGCVQVGAQLHRQVVDDAAAEAEADGAQAPCAVGPTRHVARRGEEIRHHLRPFQLPLHFRARLVGSGIAAK